MDIQDTSEVNELAPAAQDGEQLSPDYLRTREDLERIEDLVLAPYGMRSSRSRGRLYPDHEPRYRTAFQRDRDRILHTTAFRRLEYKTQVFIYHEGDYYRTRLTHTIEVAQVTRSITRTLGLNEDLAEAITLAHDLGHTPFGHSGEEALNELMRPWGGFEHNRQSLRIVTELEERYPDFPGLNLTWEVLEGIVKHETSYDRADTTGWEPELAPTLEAQISSISDEIAYNSHDLDDGLRAGMLDLEQLQQLAIWREACEAAGCLGIKLTDIQRHEVIRNILGAQVTDVTVNTARRLKQYGIGSVDDVRRHADQPLVKFSDEMLHKERELKSFLFKNMYRQYRVVRMAEKARRVIQDLFHAYTSVPTQLPPSVQHRIEQRNDLPMQRVVADYIAGMTDRFALEEYAKLFDMQAKV